MMEKEKLDEILRLHLAWLNSEPCGVKADLRGANLSEANLSGADLSKANLNWADLSGADLDYSSWNLSCKTNHVRVDRKIAAQLAAHFCVLVCHDSDYTQARDAIMEFAKTSHRASDLGLKGN